MLKNDNHTRWMKFAYNEACKAYNKDEVPVGAIIICNDTIIGRGYNQVEQLKDSTAHAEIISITSAANSIDDWRLNDSSMYVTKEPCVMCFGAIANARIKNIYYGFADEKYGFRSKLKKQELFKYNHLKNIEGNILEFDCKQIIEKFFKSKRKNNKKS